MVKDPPADVGDEEMWGRSLGQEDSLSRKWQPPLVFLPGKSVDKGAWWTTGHGVAKEKGLGA